MSDAMGSFAPDEIRSAEIKAAREEGRFLGMGGMRLAAVKVITDHAKHCHPEERAGLLELANMIAAIEAKAKEG